MVLTTLGRVGSWTLKKKVHHRAGRIIKEVGHLLLEIETVIDTAVDCRNPYVHGHATKRVMPKLCDSCVGFLTNTLEFIFFLQTLQMRGGT